MKEDAKAYERHLARNRKHYLKMIAEGRCCTCSQRDERTMAGRTRCAACEEKYRPRKQEKRMTREQRDAENADKREWGARRRAANLCTYCGRKDKRTLAGFSSCLYCATKRNAQARERRDAEHQKALHATRKQKWREEGRCTICGGPRNEEGRLTCIECRLKEKMRKVRSKIAHGKLPRGANGLCFQCNRARAMEGKRLCPECYEKRMAVFGANMERGKRMAKESKASAT